MSPLTPDPQKPFSGTDIHAWLYRTEWKRLDVRLQATEPGNPFAYHQALIEMSRLLEGAMEEVRVVSASLREESQAIRDQSTDLQHRSAQLIERGTRLTKRMLAFAPQTQEVPTTESRLLEIFKDGMRRENR